MPDIHYTQKSYDQLDPQMIQVVKEAYKRLGRLKYVAELYNLSLDTVRRIIR
jgi:hypothetical protein